MNINFDTALQNADNVSYTEKGAKGFKTTTHKLLDLNFKVPALRIMRVEEIGQLFAESYYEDEKLALKWMLYLGDIREGLGERHSFNAVLKYLILNKPDIAEKILPLIPEYSRWDYVFTYIGTSLADKALKMISDQFNSDIDALNMGKKVSLLAKWLPSENASSPTTIKLAKIIRKYLRFDSKSYRKLLSALRKHLDIVETHLCAKDWSGIDYSHVPSKANVKYNNAFKKNDGERRREFLAAVKNGETKINSSVNFPYDIVHKYTGGYYTVKPEDDAGLEALWKALPAPLKSDESTIVVQDTSGSMGITVGNNTKLTAQDVASSISIYSSEYLSGPFHNTIVTFSSKPSYIKLNDKMSLREKIATIQNNSIVDNTNIKGVFDLILKTAVDNNCSQKELPKNILIISDMEFDDSDAAYYCHHCYCGTKPDATLFEKISKEYEAHGYEIPRLIFWNVNSRSNTIPMKENNAGIVLISGFSINLFNMILNNETDPYEALKKILNSKRYEIIDKLFS